MIGNANKRVTILRGTTTDAYGDQVDDNSSPGASAGVYQDVLIGLLETTRRVYLPAEQAFRVIRTYSANVGWEVDLRKDDRIRDEATGTVYLVTEINEPIQSLGIRPDRIVQLSRTT